MTATLKSIAAKLDVSVSLVSRVLNNRMGTTGARPELIETIRRTAREMEYQKNVSAYAVRSGRHNAIGIYLHNFGRPGSGMVDALLRGISVATRRKRLRFTLEFIEADEPFPSQSAQLHKTMIDGVLLGGIPHQNVKEMLRGFLAAKIPAVTMADHALNLRTPNIGVDQVAVGRIATEHLIERGCKRIAHVVDFQDRYEGYVSAMRQHGLTIYPGLVYREGSANFSHERGRRAARHFLKAKPRLDGVFAQSDEEAVVIMHEFIDQGIRVPEEVRIIGVDNAPYCDFAHVPLSSVSQNVEEMGHQAVTMLISLMEGQSVKSVRVSPALRPRASSR